MAHVVQQPMAGPGPSSCALQTRQRPMPRPRSNAPRTHASISALGSKTSFTTDITARTLEQATLYHHSASQQSHSASQDTESSREGARQFPASSHCRRHLLLSATALALQPLVFNPAHAAIVEEDLSVGIFDRCIGSVVSVITSRLNKAKVLEQQGVGSGFVWAQDKDAQTAWVVTNYHVISRLDKTTDVIRVAVRPPGSTTPVTHTAQLVATDTMNDLAVLSVDAALPPLLVGTSTDLQIGQSVFAVGAPYGLSSSLTAGVVSGLNRSIPSPVGTRIYGAIQTDASINAGNSGGPLLDSSGRVIGINTATFTRTGSGRGSGVNFALPIDAVRDIVPKLIVYGNARGKRV